MAKKCCGGRTVVSFAQTTDKSPVLKDQQTTKVQYLGRNGTTWQSPSRVTYKVSQSRPIVEILESDKAWFLSRQEQGRFFFAPVDEPAKETVANTELPAFEVKQEEILADQIEAEEKAAEAEAKQDTEEEASAKPEPEEDDKPKRKRRRSSRSSK